MSSSRRGLSGYSLRLDQTGAEFAAFVFVSNSKVAFSLTQCFFSFSSLSALQAFSFTFSIYFICLSFFHLFQDCLLFLLHQRLLTPVGLFFTAIFWGDEDRLVWVRCCGGEQRGETGPVKQREVVCRKSRQETKVSQDSLPPTPPPPPIAAPWLSRSPHQIGPDSPSEPQQHSWYLFLLSSLCVSVSLTLFKI